LARCYVQVDRDRVLDKARRLIGELSRIPGRPGYFTEIFCIRSRFFQPKNGARIDAIREAIAEMNLDPDLEAVALVSLMEAADRVDSTTGVQMAYLKTWAPRSFDDLELLVPDLLPGPGLALQKDALEAAEDIEADVAYLDPPYNQHSYLGNYHIWETLVRWDKPDTYGVACKRTDCKKYKSAFNSKREAFPALARLVETLRAKHLILSFSDEGFIGRDEMEALLRQRGYVGVIAVPYKRYVGAQIGIYNPKGELVGKVSHLRNMEYLYVVSKDRKALDAVLARVGAHQAWKQLALPF
jgi:adenine-specific DNA-methyltransferase